VLQRQVAAPAPELPPLEVRLPYVEAVYLPDVIYAGEPFIVRFALSAPAHPQALLLPAPHIPVSEVQYLSEEGYSGSLFLAPWRADPPAGQAYSARSYSTLDYTVCVQAGGRYHLQYWGADARGHGGLPGAYAWKGAFQYFSRPETIELWALEFDVLPSRLPAGQGWSGTAGGAWPAPLTPICPDYPGCVAPYTGCAAPYNEHVWVSNPSCPGTTPCSGVNGNPQQQWHPVRPQPRPVRPQQPPARTHRPTVHPQARPVPPPQVQATPANLALVP
jgi:hypothetical protein